ncbi:hypothetical protein [Shouchella miscanthi]|uniref:Uncharacterized protein n=1 Tax=Shouchella miscanthi TaxID=2598861 RepID=A0ABU6NKS6_9BACI|nr:hypothetical protein [Shouchella miscanthi]
MLDPIERIIAIIALLLGGYASTVNATIKILDYRNKRKKERYAERSDEEAKG